MIELILWVLGYLAVGVGVARLGYHFDKWSREDAALGASIWPAVVLFKLVRFLATAGRR